MPMTLVWLGAMIVLLLLEIPTTGLITIWFAGGSLAALLTALAGLPPSVQGGVFVAVSLLLLFFTRPVAAKYLNSRTTETNVNGIPGKTAVVTEPIDNLRGAGRVSVEGKSWSARSVDGEPIGKDELVTVREVQGVKLMVVRKAKEE